MSKKLIVIIAGAIVVFITILFLGLLRNVPGTTRVDAPPETRAKSAGLVTQEQFSDGAETIVPNEDTENVPQNVAKPTEVAPADPTGAAKLRIFNVVIENNSFKIEGDTKQNTVVVNFNDRTRINVTAVDKDYDFFQPNYGFVVNLKKGEMKFADFQASAEGKFTIFCRSCGGPEKGPLMYLVVVPKN